MSVALLVVPLSGSFQTPTVTRTWHPLTCTLGGDIHAARCCSMNSPCLTGSQDQTSSATSSIDAGSRSSGARSQHLSTSSGSRHRFVADDDPSAGSPGEGFVGLFVAGWTGLLSVLLWLLQPIMSLALLLAQPLTHTSPARARAQLDKWVSERDGWTGTLQIKVYICGCAKICMVQASPRWPRGLLSLPSLGIMAPLPLPALHTHTSEHSSTVSCMD